MLAETFTIARLVGTTLLTNHNLATLRCFWRMSCPGVGDAMRRRGLPYLSKLSETKLTILISYGNDLESNLLLPTEQIEKMNSR
jgi:hypothetical protein